jgi:hypothetical protein
MDLDDHLTAVFHVNIFGEEDHSEVSLMQPRKCTDEQCDAIGTIFRCSS